MISRANKSSISIRRDDVSMSDRDIISRYMGINKFPCSIQSPIREDDDRPSFAMQERDGHIYWKDFGTGDSGDAVSLMAKLWNVSYTDSLLKIKLDNEYKIPRASLIRRYKGKLHLTSSSAIQVRIREWKQWDIDYWKSYGISKDFCTKCNVYPISHAFFTKTDDNNYQYTVTVPMDKYAYAYFEWKDGKQSIKLYQPFSASMKWLSKHDSSVWDLWKQAFKYASTISNDNVIITSSRKDAMCLWESLGIPAMSLQGEGYMPKPQVMQQVIDTFKNVYIWYDNDFTHKEDNPGQDNAHKLIEIYHQLKNICIPAELQSKDPSDLVKNWGTLMLKEVWNTQK